MIRSVLLLFLLAAAGLAEHEDVVDKILVALSTKFVKTSVPYYISSMSQKIKSLDVRVILALRNGEMSLTKLVRNGEVKYATTDEEATFKFKASLETSIAYDYSLSSTSSQISFGSATTNWKSVVNMVITATTEGCQLTISDTRNTSQFDLHFEPRESNRFPLTIHYPIGDVVEKNVIPAIDSALNQAFTGWTICEIFDCD